MLIIFQSASIADSRFEVMEDERRKIPRSPSTPTTLRLVGLCLAVHQQNVLYPGSWVSRWGDGWLSREIHGQAGIWVAKKGNGCLCREMDSQAERRIAKKVDEWLSIEMGG
jgi:hypothetical protein